MAIVAALFLVACEDAEVVNAKRSAIAQQEERDRQAQDARVEAEANAKWSAVAPKYRQLLEAAGTRRSECSADFGCAKNPIEDYASMNRHYKEVASIPSEKRTFRQNEQYLDALSGIKGAMGLVKDFAAPVSTCSDTELITELKKHYFLASVPTLGEYVSDPRRAADHLASGSCSEGIYLAAEHASDRRIWGAAYEGTQSSAPDPTSKSAAGTHGPFSRRARATPACTR